MDNVKERLASDVKAVANLMDYCSSTTCGNCMFQKEEKCRLEMAVSSGRRPKTWDKDMLENAVTKSDIGQKKAEVPTYVISIKGLC